MYTGMYRYGRAEEEIEPTIVIETPDEKKSDCRFARFALRVWYQASRWWSSGVKWCREVGWKPLQG